MLIFIAGGTGFVGSHLVPELSKRGIKTRCLLRSAERAPRCVGAETVRGTLDKIPRGALDSVDMVVHLVGILAEAGPDTFESVVSGTANLVEEALVSGVKRFFYQSSLGASLRSRNRYQKTKAQAEEIVKDSGMGYTIFRPSLILGRDDGFTKQMVSLINSSPVVPVPGMGAAKFQPLAISDWVKCFLSMLENGRFMDGTYEFGGPEQFSFNDLLTLYMKTMGVEKKLVHVPAGIVKTGIGLLQFARAAGLRKLPPVGEEQLALLETDNITDPDSIKKQFGFEPVNIRQALKEYLRAQEAK